MKRMKRKYLNSRGVMKGMTLYDAEMFLNSLGCQEICKVEYNKNELKEIIYLIDQNRQYYKQTIYIISIEVPPITREDSFEYACDISKSNIPFEEMFQEVK